MIRLMFKIPVIIFLSELQEIILSTCVFSRQELKMFNLPQVRDQMRIPSDVSLFRLKSKS